MAEWTILYCPVVLNVIVFFLGLIKIWENAMNLNSVCVCYSKWRVTAVFWMCLFFSILINVWEMKPSVYFPLLSLYCLCFVWVNPSIFNLGSVNVWQNEFFLILHLFWVFSIFLGLINIWGKWSRRFYFPTLVFRHVFDMCGFFSPLISCVGLCLRLWHLD